jgi:hypothetical protein
LRLTRIGSAVGRRFTLQELKSFKDAKPINGLYYAVSPKLGKTLRTILKRLPQVKLILTSLESLAEEGKARVNLYELYYRARSVNRELADVLFLNPRLLDELLDDKDRVVLDRLERRHFRGTTPFQLKRMLAHAGLVLGVARSGKQFIPEEDWWELRD